MSDEAHGLEVLSQFAAGATWFAWYFFGLLGAPRCSRIRHRWPVLVAPVICAGTLFAVPMTSSSFAARSDRDYLAFYLLLGAAWVGGAGWLLPYLGLSLRDDVIERVNPGAAHAIGGALLGLTFCFAGANAGDGRGWGMVVFAALLATAAFALFWILLDQVTGLADIVTIDRDRAAGLRVAGLFAGAGLILGGAVAGGQDSATPILVHFLKTGWPVGVLGLVASGLERRLRPSPARPELPPATHGVLPAALYSGIAILSTAWAAWWT